MSLSWDSMSLQMKRKLLFTPCETKEALQNWIRQFLGYDLPDCTVDPSSNSSPMSLVWEIYDKALKNDDPDFSTVLAYASRESMKTLVTAVLEVLCLLHLGRSVVHLAAILDQAKKAQGYVRDLFFRPVMRDFLALDNDRNKSVVRWESKETGEILNEKEFRNLSDADPKKEHFVQHKYDIVIVVATLQSVNGQHAPFMCVDGQTDLLVYVGDKKKAGNRKRERRNARGLFNLIAGLPVSGRIASNVSDLEISDPACEVNVLSFNFNTGSFEFKRITRGHRKTVENAIKIVTKNSEIICTPDHPLYLHGKGFREASDIVVGDSLVSVGRAKSNIQRAVEADGDRKGYVENQVDEWDQVVLGSLLGDMGIHKKKDNNPYLYENHCIEQEGYLSSKRAIVSRKLRTRDSVGVKSGYTGRAEVGFASGCSPILMPYADFKKSLTGAERLGALGLAVWYMDDGCSGNSFKISSESFTEEQNRKLVGILKKNFDIEAEVHSYTKEGNAKPYYYIMGGIEAKRRLVEVCRKHIHPSMAYKFDLSGNFRRCSKCNEEVWYYESGNRALTCGSAICRNLQTGSLKEEAVISIEKLGRRTVYDFTVEGNHNFFGNSILNKNCVDEIDVMTDMRVYNESKMIPTPFAGKSPITLLTSSRKFSYGIVQKEIDNAENTGTHVRHWNLLDVTQGCPKTRHRPDLPILNVYVNNDTLTTVTEADYKTFSSDQKEKHVPDKAYSGCMSNCKIFAQCRGRLARKPPDPVHKAATMLKPISHVQNSFKKVDLDMAKAQLLCWKPSTTGLIYQYFDREIHMVTPAQMAEMITGEPQNPNLTKPQLVLSLIANGGMRFVAGIDWGFTHNFSCVLAAIDGQRAFIIEVISQAELETGDQIEIVKERIGKFNPKIYADSEDPQAISTFRKKGFKISPVQKGPGSVVAGIGVVRAALRDAAGSPPRLYLLKGDEGCAFLAKQMGIYHWKTDASGRVSDVPDHEASDENDALRYLMMSVFGKFGKVSAAKESTPVPTQPQAQNWMQSAIDTALGRDGTGPIVDLTGGSARGGVQKKGNLLWDFGGE